MQLNNPTDFPFLFELIIFPVSFKTSLTNFLVTGVE